MKLILVWNLGVPCHFLTLAGCIMHPLKLAVWFPLQFAHLICSGVAEELLSTMIFAVKGSYGELALHQKSLDLSKLVLVIGADFDLIAYAFSYYIFRYSVDLSKNLGVISKYRLYSLFNFNSTSLFRVAVVGISSSLILHVSVIW